MTKKQASLLRYLAEAGHEGRRLNLSQAMSAVGLVREGKVRESYVGNHVKVYVITRQGREGTCKLCGSENVMGYFREDTPDEDGKLLGECCGYEHHYGLSPYDKEDE